MPRFLVLAYIPAPTEEISPEEAQRITQKYYDCRRPWASAKKERRNSRTLQTSGLSGGACLQSAGSRVPPKRGEDLVARVPGLGLTLFELALSIACAHEAYHAGQIQYLKLLAVDMGVR